jgi:hypothetical protein
MDIDSLPYVQRVNHSRRCNDVALASLTAGEPFMCVDREHCELVSAQFHAGNAYVAFTDGAIWPFTGADIERQHARLSREYDRTSSALIAYRRTVRTGSPIPCDDDMADHETYRSSAR